MKNLVRILIVLMVILTAFAPVKRDNPTQSENVEFNCMKMQKATNTCHFNFKIDGAKFRFVDIGCKYNKKQKEVIKKAKEGSIALARDWKVDCPEEKPKKESAGL